MAIRIYLLGLVGHCYGDNHVKLILKYTNLLAIIDPPGPAVIGGH